MQDWDYRPEDGQENKKKERGGVTRKEFYACVLILLAVIFWRTGTLAESMQRQENNAQYTLQRIDDVSTELYQISDEVATGVAEANSPFEECAYEIVDVDLRAKTVTLHFSAQPKEYRAGATALRFFLTCDKGEPIAIDAVMGENRSFTAEKEIPLCGTVAATAALQLGDTEYLADLGSLAVKRYAYPDFTGFFGCSYEWTGDRQAANVDGTIQMDVTPGEWMLNQNQALELHDPTAEIYLDGKRVQSIPMRTEIEDSTFSSYICEIEDAFLMKQGQVLEIYFKAEDANGLKYTYLIERTHIANQDIMTEEPGEGRLVVE